MDFVWPCASKGIDLCLQHGQLLGSSEASKLAGGGFGERNTVSACIGSLSQENRVGACFSQSKLKLFKPDPGTHEMHHKLSLMTLN